MRAAAVRRACAACAAAIAVCLPAGPAAACPQRLPAGLSAVAVGEDVAVNGLQLSILQVRGKGKAADVLDRLERTWRDAHYDVKRNSVAGWSVLSALSEQCLTTLQLSDREGVFGYLAVNKLKPAAPMAAVPVPAGATVLSSVGSDDGGRKGSTLALTSSWPLDRLREFYMRSLQEDKWGAVSADVTLGADRRPNVIVVSAQRGNEQLRVVLWRDGQSQVVVNRTHAL